MHTRLTGHFFSAQRGAALVVSMVMLLVITVIGVAVMGGSHLEWLMANNSHLQTDAYRNAEIALAAGLGPGSISNPPTTFPPTSPAPSSNPRQLFTDVANWSNGSISSTLVPTTTGSAAYALEYIGCSRYAPPVPLTFQGNNCSVQGQVGSYIFVYTYRVWALGADGKGAARILEATRSLIYNQGVPSPVGGHNWPPGGTIPLPSLDNQAETPSS